MGLPSFIKDKIIASAVKKVADSEPRTTAVGMVMAGVVAANIDYSKLLQKDPQQIGILIGAIAAGLLGYWTNHKSVTQSAPPPK